MPRVAVALSCTAETMAELERLSRSRSGEVRMAERARIVLACLRGKRNDEIAREMSLRPNTVGQWRQRFAARGLAGLQDAPRSGKPAKYGVELRDRILARLELDTCVVARSALDLHHLDVGERRSPVRVAGGEIVDLRGRRVDDQHAFA